MLINLSISGAMGGVSDPQDSPVYPRTMAAHCEKFFKDRQQMVVQKISALPAEDHALERFAPFVRQTVYSTQNPSFAKAMITVVQYRPGLKFAKRLAGDIVVDSDRAGNNDLIQKKITFRLAGKQAILFLTGFRTRDNLILFANTEQSIKKLNRQFLRAKILASAPLTGAGISAGILLLGGFSRYIDAAIVSVLGLAALSWWANSKATDEQEFADQLLQDMRPALKNAVRAFDRSRPDIYRALLVLQDDAQYEAVNDFLEQSGLEAQ